MQLEILMNAIPRVVGKLMPLLLEGTLVIAGTSTAMMLHVGQVQDERAKKNISLIVLYQSGTMATLVSWFGVFYALHMLEQMAEESVALLKDVEMELMLLSLRLPSKLPRRTRGELSGWQLPVRVTKFKARMFRRRVLRLRIGDFSSVETGSAAEHFRLAAENIITYALMIDFSSPMWII